MRPKREHATNYGQTYMVTTETWGRRALFRAEPWARLIVDTLYHYRGSAYLLHEFVVMPEHIHLLITPLATLEKAAQFIKGGFSYRARKELGSNLEIWQTGFSDHRIRDAKDYAQHVRYIRENPVRKGIVIRAEDYPYSSAFGGFELDDVPLGLKPQNFVDASGAPKGAPLQNADAIENAPKGASVQNNSKAEGAISQDDSKAEGLAFQNNGKAKGAPLQNEDAIENGPKGASFQNNSKAEGATSQDDSKAEGAALQTNSQDRKKTHAA